VASFAALTPRERIAHASRTLGSDEVVTRCRVVLDGGEMDDYFATVLGGQHAPRVLSGHDPEYWLRTWALRCFLYEWNDHATPDVITAADDEAWRVREMAFKVIARRLIGNAFDVTVAHQNDHVSRVRAAAERALGRLTSEES
jgi:hypothetical protein